MRSSYVISGKTVEELAQAISSCPAWEELVSKFALSDSPDFRQRKGAKKYLDVNGWLRTCESRWKAIRDYDGSLVSTHTSVLDIGTGFGYFPLVGKHIFGIHNIDATEAEDVLWEDVYRLATNLFGLKVYPLTLERLARSGISNGDIKYDLVTAYRTVFDMWNGPWYKEDWLFFLRDVSASLLKENGTLVLAFNSQRSFEIFVKELQADTVQRKDRCVALRKKDIEQL